MAARQALAQSITMRSITTAIRNINRERTRGMIRINTPGFTLGGPDSWELVYRLAALNRALHGLERAREQYAAIQNIDHDELCTVPYGAA